MRRRLVVGWAGEWQVLSRMRIVRFGCFILYLRRVDIGRIFILITFGRFVVDDRRVLLTLLLVLRLFAVFTSSSLTSLISSAFLARFVVLALAMSECVGGVCSI